MKLGILELSLIQIIMYSLIWLVNSYLGFLLCLIIGSIAAALLILSLILEVIEKSKVPKSYYRFMLSAVLCPSIVMVTFIALYPDAMSWMQP